MDENILGSNLVENHGCSKFPTSIITSKSCHLAGTYLKMKTEFDVYTGLYKRKGLKLFK